MKQIVIIALLVVAFNSYAKYYPGTLTFENGKSREGFIESNLGDVILFKGWMEAEPEEILAAGVKTVWIKTNAGHKMHEYHYLLVDAGSDKVNHRMWLKPLEKGTVNLFVHDTILQQDGLDKTEALDFYCLRDGEKVANLIASHNDAHVFKSKAAHFFADRPLLVQKIKSKEYTWENVQQLVSNYNHSM